MFNEAEIQLMIAMLELLKPVETPNNNGYEFYPKDLQQASRYFRGFLTDWSGAYASLLEKGVLGYENSRFYLTGDGIGSADKLRRERPPIWYWYKDYYLKTAESKAHARYCEMLFGLNLCQDGFSDMQQIMGMLEIAKVNPGDQILDLGCGSGMISEYISDVTGAQMYGIDYIPDAIEQAERRTSPKKDRLEFRVGNLDHLDFPDSFFDLIISIDTLYMPESLDSTVRQIKRILKPEGALAAFYSQFLWDNNAPRELLKSENTDLARSLIKSGFTYKAYDLSKENFDLMQRKRQVAEQLAEDYRQEGNAFLYENIREQSLDGNASYDPDSFNISRYLYFTTGTS